MHRGSVEGEERPHQPVISPKLSFFYGSNDLEITDVLPMGDNIVNQMPLLRLGVHLCGLVLVCQS